MEFVVKTPFHRKFLDFLYLYLWICEYQVQAAIKGKYVF